MTQTIETTTQSRYCKVTIGNLIAATVSQHVSPVDFKMIEPFVAWPSLVSESDLNFVQAFGEALQQAAAIAREWAQDTGKDYREVLPQ